MTYWCETELINSWTLPWSNYIPLCSTSWRNFWRVYHIQISLNSPPPSLSLFPPFPSLSLPPHSLSPLINFTTLFQECLKQVIMVPLWWGGHTAISIPNPPLTFSFFSKWWTATLTTWNRIFQCTVFFKTLNVHHPVLLLLCSRCSSSLFIPLHLHCFFSAKMANLNPVHYCPVSASSLACCLVSALTFLTWNVSCVSTSFYHSQDKILGSIVWCRRLFVNWTLLLSSSSLLPHCSHTGSSYSSIFCTPHVSKA